MKKKLLLVEDESLVALTERITLQKNGYQVEIVNSGEKAIEYMNIFGDVDLILMDINLNGITGPQAAREILKNYDIPIVFLSSHTEKEIVDKIKNITNYGYVVKNSGEFVLVESIEMAFNLYKAHKESKKNEYMFKSLFENAPVGVFKSSSSGDLLSFNKKFASILGYENEDDLRSYVSNAYQLYVYKENRSNFLETLKSLGQVENMEVEMITKSGDSKWASISAKIENISNDKFTIDGFFVDIDDEKKEANLVKFMEERFRSLFHEMNDCVAIYEPINDGEDFKLIDANPSAKKLSKIKDEDIGRNLLEIFPRVEEIGLLDALRKTYKTSETTYLPLVKYEDNRIEQWVNNTIYKINNNEIVAIYSDATEIKIAEKNLMTSKESLEITLNSIGDAVVVVDINKNIISLNPVAKQLLGCEEDCIGSHIDDCFKIFYDDGSPAANPLDAAIKENNVAFLDDGVKLHSFNGKEFYISDSAAPLKDFDGGVKGAVLVFRDVTQKKEGEDRLKKAFKEQSLMSSELIHRVKNNISLIRSLISLKFQNEDISDILSQIDAIQILNDKLQNLEDDLSIEVKPYILDLIHTILNNFYDKEVKINDSIDENIFFNSKKIVSIGLIVNELTTNAIKHGFTENPEIDVSLHYNDDQSVYCLNFSNSGNKIPENIEEGFGIQILKSQVDQLDGSLIIDSENSMFRICFPAI